MPLSQTVQLSNLGQELLTGVPTDNRVQSQVLDATRPTLSSVTQGLDAASNTANRSFDTAVGTLDRQTRGLGVNVTASQRRATERRIGLSRALANVDARNRAVSTIRQNADAARSGASGLRDIVNSQVLQARSSTAGMEAGREMEYQQNVAEWKAKRRKAIGDMVGIGLSFVPGGQFLAPMVSGAIANG